MSNLLGSCFVPFFFFLGFYLLFLERGEGREKERRETSMCERNIHGLPLSRSQPGTRPATQAHALTGNPFSSQAGTESTEPHQPGCFVLFYLFIFYFKGFAFSAKNKSHCNSLKPVLTLFASVFHSLCVCVFV